MQISIKHTQKTQSTENTNTSLRKTRYIWGGRRIGSHLQCALAVVAPEAGPVVDPVVGGELVDQVHRLGARRALGRRPLERHRFSSCPNQRGNLKNEQRIPYTSSSTGRQLVLMSRGQMGGEGDGCEAEGQEEKEEVRCRESRRDEQMEEGEREKEKDNY
ncbi:hypothetical protein BHM03_00040654 [Ensete ventricosum]|nr:hypothetical protein BHM03_00040654 [Ensete ventricosum]